MTTLSPLSTSPASASSGQPHTSPIVGSAPSRAGVPPTSTSSAPSALPKPPSKSKPRKRVNTAEKRNQHNAIERQRRETLNVRFISLARLLPGLATHRRPSKSAIVNNSITHLSAQREQRLLAARLLRQLCAERDALAKEVAEWRFANGLAQSPAPGPSAWSDEMEEVCGVENETFGTFANVDGGDEQEDEDADEFDESAMMGLGMGVGSAPQMQLPQIGTNEMSLEQAAAFAATFNAHGLLTPRSSTDIGAGAANLSGFSGPSIWGQHAQAQVAPGPNGFAHVPSQSQSQSQGQTHAMPTPPSLAPGSLRSSTASLPFNAFMSDSASPANSASGYSAHVPTPPTTGDFAAFLQQQAQIAQQQQQRQQQQQQHTPSPRSSHSHPDEVRAQQPPAPQQQQQQQQHVWSEQQLLFLRAIQQQQQQQHQQQQRQSVSQSQPQAQNSQPFNPLAFANSFASGNGGDLTPNAASDAYNFFAAIQQQQQQQQQSQAQPVPLMQHALQMHSAMTDANANANNANAGANASETGPVPPPLHRAQSENLEAWRRGSAMFAHPHPAQPSVADFKNAFRAGMGMGMVWEHGPVRAVEGF